jgi:hypothetical protein
VRFAALLTAGGQLTSSWWMTQSGCCWKQAEEGWMYTGCCSTTLLYPSWASLRAAWKKNPDVMALQMMV